MSLGTTAVILQHKKFRVSELFPQVADHFRPASKLISVARGDVTEKDAMMCGGLGSAERPVAPIVMGTTMPCACLLNALLGHNVKVTEPRMAFDLSPGGAAVFVCCTIESLEKFYSRFRARLNCAIHQITARKNHSSGS